LFVCFVFKQERWCPSFETPDKRASAQTESTSTKECEISLDVCIVFCLNLLSFLLLLFFSYDVFVQKLGARMTSLVTGNGFEAGVTQGPLIDSQGLAKVRPHILFSFFFFLFSQSINVFQAQQHIADAVSKGALLRQGSQSSLVSFHSSSSCFFFSGGAQTGRGLFLAPTLLANVTNDMLVAREETFGPVAAVFRFGSESEVVAAANNTEFGLASYIYTRDVGRVVRVAEQLEYGMVGVNTGLISTAEVPFGGVKQSGVGREGARHGLDEYLEMKYICLSGL
jgi:succinate-semialdehyde dehydrogenase/glutarate-semialdehyde dehydrogenase